MLTAECISGFGPRSASGSRSSSKTGRRSNWNPRPTATSLAPLGPTPVPGTVTGWTTTRRSIPTRPRGFSPKVRTGRRRSSTRRHSAGPTPTGPASGCPARSSTRCTSAPSRRRAPGPPRREQLPALKEAGITVVEVMPVADFPGRFGWGYDGVDLFAPTRLYGRPDDFRAFVNGAHRLGLGVILDVVYNHLGPDGNYLGQFADGLFHRPTTRPNGARRSTSTAPDSGPVREFFAANAGYWIDEYHLDGLRLDATQSIFDDSPRHILVEIGAAVREAAGRRSIILVNENEPQQVAARPPGRAGRLRAGRALERRLPPHRHGRPDRPQRGLLHRLPRRAAGVHLRGQVRLPLPGPVVQVAKEAARHARRSASPPAAFVTFIQNHDQVANSGRGLRLSSLTSPGRYRAMTALLAARPGHADAVPGAGIRGVQPVPFLRRPRAGVWPSWSARAGRSSWPSSRASPSRTCRPACRTRPTRRRSSGASSIRPSAKGIDRSWTCTATCCDCGVTSRRFAPRPGGVDGAVLGPEAFVLRFFGDDRAGRTIGCWS